MATDMAKRLSTARKAAGFDSGSDAAKSLGVEVPTYLGHENGSRGFKRQNAELYARRYGVNLEWLLTGRGQRERARAAIRGSEPRVVPVVGYVSAGVANFYDDQGQLGEVPAPDDSSEDTVAVEVRGESLGPVFERWLAFYDDVQRPVSTDHIGRLCVVGLPDGRILVKKVVKARGKPGTYHLLSNTEPPILDTEIEWAARVRSMVQR